MRFAVPLTSIRKIKADGVQVFYRAADNPNAPVVLLLHGFPTSPFMFRELIPRLADHYQVIALDLPGFGFTEVPVERKYTYSFDALALTIGALTEALKIKRCALYVFDYGGANRFPAGDGAPRTSSSNRFTERKRVSDITSCPLPASAR
jgi:alpha-beta hydrolase superfamily lysophospholipase